MESNRRDNPLFSAKALSGLLNKMLMDGAEKAELVDYSRRVMDWVLNNRVPLEDLVMSQNISKPLHLYVDAKGRPAKLAHVVTARALIERGFPVLPGDRVEMLFVCEPGGRSEKALAYKLYNEEVSAVNRRSALTRAQPLDFGYYANAVVGPFTRALKSVLSPAELNALWNLNSYDRLVPSTTSGNRGPLKRYITLSDRVYTLRKATCHEKKGLPVQASIARFFSPRQ